MRVESSNHQRSPAPNTTFHLRSIGGHVLRELGLQFVIQICRISVSKPFYRNGKLPSCGVYWLCIVDF